MSKLEDRFEAEFGATKASSSAHAQPSSSDYADSSSMFDEMMKARATVRAFMEEKLPKPAHTRIFSVSNQKGGVGKTTTTVNIAAALAKGGLNVLVIDADPQGNASTALGVRPSAGSPSIYHALNGTLPLNQVVYPVPEMENLWIVPSTIDLAMAEVELVMSERREYRLRKALTDFFNDPSFVEFDLDYVFIDSPPSLGMLTLNALVAANEVMIPIQAEYYALEGLTQLMATITSVKQAFNPDLHISTILLTMFDKRTNLANDVAADVEQYFPNELLEARIPRNVRISEAPSFGQTVIQYDPKSSGSAAYMSAAKEIALHA